MTTQEEGDKIGKAVRVLLIITLAVVVLYVLVAMIVPQFMRYGLNPKIRAHNEAKRNLGSIFTSQVTYYGEEDTYASSIENLGRAPEGKTYYSYSIIEADSTHFLVRAKGNIDKDPTLDIWEFNEKRELKNVVND